MSSFLEKLKRGMSNDIALKNDEAQENEEEKKRDFLNKIQLAPEKETPPPEPPETENPLPKTKKGDQSKSVKSAPKKTAPKTTKKKAELAGAKATKDIAKETEKNNLLSGESQNLLMPKKEVKIEEKNQEDNSRNFSIQNLSLEEGQLVVDVYQTEKDLVLQSAIAGVKPEKIDISVQGDVIIIKGKRERPLEKSERNYFYQECYWGPFSKEIILPVEADTNRISASMTDGILTIRIPKVQGDGKVKIEVK